MKPNKKPNPPARPKKAKRIAIAAAGAISIAALSFPIWSVWLAKPIASMAGVEMKSLEASSWDRWEIKGLTLKQPTANIQAAHIQLPSPTKLAQLFLSSGAEKQTLLVDDWSIAINTKGSAEPQPSQAHSLGELVAFGKDSLTQLGQYLTSIQIENGLVQIDDQQTLSIPKVKLSPVAFSAELEYLPQSIPLSLEAEFSDTWTLSLNAPSLEVSSHLELLFTPEQVSLAGQIVTSQNPIEVAAGWNATSATFLPTQISTTTKHFALDGRYPIWKQAHGLYLNSSIEWADQALTYRITGSDKLDAAAHQQIEIEGTGSLDLIEIETAKIDLPYLEVRNKGPIRINPRLDNPLADAQLTAKLDLSQIPFIEATGTLVADLQTKASDDDLPIIIGKLTGYGIELYDTAIAQIDGALEIHGQDLQLHSFQLKTVAGSTLSGKGGFDLTTQSIAPTSLKVALLNESKMLAAFAPNLNWTSLSGDIHIQGPASNATVQATLDSQDLELPGTQPFSIAAELDGSFTDIGGTVYAKNEEQIFQLGFESKSSEQEKNYSISKLELSARDATKLIALESPFSISIQNKDSSITSTGLTLSGSHGLSISLQNISLDQERLSLSAQIENVTPGILNSWLATPLPPLTLHTFETQIAIDQKGATLTSSGLVNWPIKNSSTIDLAWQAHSETTTDSLSIDNIKISTDQKDIISANGTFPLSIRWIQGSPIADINANAPLAFSLKSSPNPDFWNALNEVLPVSLKRPIIDAQFSGSIAAPEGRFNVSLDSLVWHDPQATDRTISINDLKAILRADTKALSIETLDAHSGKNAIHAQAILPLGKLTLTDLLKQPDAIDLQELDAKASIQILELEALKAWLPGMIRHSGQANISVKMKDGDISAAGELKSIATRSLPPIAALSDISGSFNYEKGIFKTEGIKGLADKKPFLLAGQADINSLENPVFDLQFISKEFPLVRDDGLLVSGDIDMNVITADDGQTHIKGNLILKKGLALLEPDLLASTTTTVSTRPPYFAVEQSPFNEWGLDIKIRGDQFLRVSNSYFQGTLSAEFDLEGNLGTPLLIGKAETYGGRIFFPASSLKLKTGQGFITRDQPTVLQIEAQAQGRLFANDINLDVSGTADNPELVITSNPAMTQVEALLLLTTGALPNDGGNLAQQSATSLGVFIGKGLFKKLTGGNSDSASKLNLEIGQDISHQGKKTIEATYQLSEKLELEGEYDKRDEFNTNLKWTIFKR